MADAYNWLNIRFCLISEPTRDPEAKTKQDSKYGEQVNAWLTLLCYHTYSIWLFTLSDIKTIIVPSTLFGIMTGVSSSSFDMEAAPASNGIVWVVLSLIRTLFWTWINLLPFAIENQRQPQAIEEDLANKPWRTLPSRRMTAAQAKKITCCLYPTALIVSLKLGGFRQSASLIILGFWYNYLYGADVSFIIRNLINACGYICFTSGALEIALRRDPFLNSRLVAWLGMIFMTVFLTVHTQDMYDQAGDRLRGRKTMPLEVGDAAARWTVAVPMVILSFWCPRWWSLPLVSYIVPIALGLSVAVRTLTRRSVQDDKWTFRIWNLWMLVLYSLPVIKLICNGNAVFPFKSTAT